MSKQRRAKDISIKVKKIVEERDRKLCVICKKIGSPNAHYISRAQGGLGIEENIVTLCFKCHYEMDHTTKRKMLLSIVRRYLDNAYPEYDNNKRYYKK